MQVGEEREKEKKRGGGGEGGRLRGGERLRGRRGGEMGGKGGEGEAKCRKMSKKSGRSFINFS